MIRTEMLLEAAGGRSAISKQAPVTLIAECALLRRKRTAELANRIPSALGPSPWPTNREPRCALRSDDTDARCAALCVDTYGGGRIGGPSIKGPFFLQSLMVA